MKKLEARIQRLERQFATLSSFLFQRKKDSGGQLEWREFGPGTSSVLVLYTLSPRGDGGEARRGVDCGEEELEFSDPQGKTIVLKPANSHSMIFALRDESGAISEERVVDFERN